MEDYLVSQWYERYKTGIYRYLLTMTRDPGLAEDVLQDTFVKVLTEGVRCQPGKEQAWLYRVARNRCVDLLRREKNQPRFPVEEGQDGQWEFLELIAPLSQRDREIVTLKIVGGFSHREIAKITGSTVGAAKKRYERAIQTLRAEMEVTEWKKS